MSEGKTKQFLINNVGVRSKLQLRLLRLNSTMDQAQNQDFLRIGQIIFYLPYP